MSADHWGSWQLRRPVNVNCSRPQPVMIDQGPWELKSGRSTVDVVRERIKIYRSSSFTYLYRYRRQCNMQRCTTLAITLVFSSFQPCSNTISRTLHDIRMTITSPTAHHVHLHTVYPLVYQSFGCFSNHRLYQASFCAMASRYDSASTVQC